MYEDLSEGLATMRYYVGLDVEGTESIPDIDQMEKTLEELFVETIGGIES